MKDKIGIITSLTCIIHCLFFPIMATSFPIFYNFDHKFEFILICIAIFIGAFSFLEGLLKHKFYIPLSLFLFGFALILLSILFNIEQLNISGLVFIILAHYSNYRKTKEVDGGHPHNCKH